MTSSSADLRQWPRPAVSIMVFRDDQVLLGQRSKAPMRGIWSLPGGRIEPGETVHAAGLRELAEETGVVAEIVGQAGTRDIIQTNEEGVLTAHYVLSVLIGRWLDGEAIADSDCMDVAWVPVGSLESWDLTDGTAQLVRETYESRATWIDRPGEAL